MQTLCRNFEVHDTEKLEKLGLTGKIGLAIEVMDYGYYGFNIYITPPVMAQLRLMKQAFITGPISAALTRSWYMTDEFNDYILRVAQSGVQSYWLLDNTNRLLDASVQMAMKLSNAQNADEEMAEPLTLDRIAGIFYTFILGIILSLCVFIGEIIHRRYKK